MRPDRWPAAALLLTLTAVWAATSGPTAGDHAPMLEVDAVNDRRGAFCLTCEAGQEPNVLIFATRNDDQTKALISAVHRSVRANQAKKLHGAVVFTGAQAAFDNLAGWARQQQMTLPLARLAAGAEPLRPWKLNREVNNTTVFILEHDVHHSVADLAADRVGQQVGTILN